MCVNAVTPIGGFLFHLLASLVNAPLPLVGVLSHQLPLLVDLTARHGACLGPNLVTPQRFGVNIVTPKDRAPLHLTHKSAHRSSPHARLNNRRCEVLSHFRESTPVRVPEPVEACE
jgi:hypothetical protein